MAEFDKPSNTEEDYFAREEIEAKRKLALQQAKSMAQAEKDRLKAEHYMHCPKCGHGLQSIQKGRIEVDVCFNCQGLWLDAGELEALTRQGPESTGGVMDAILNWVRHPAKGKER